jgi:hypothetical protein
MKLPVQDRRKMALQTNILRFLYVGGILTTALIAPKLLSLIGPPDRSQPRRRELYARITLARYRLEQRGLIRKDEKANGTYLRLTPKGEKSIEKILAREYRIPAKNSWLWCERTFQAGSGNCVHLSLKRLNRIGCFASTSVFLCEYDITTKSVL